ncbi:WSC-domain-containing protein, partial [Mytilinidion resinicola]
VAVVPGWESQGCWIDSVGDRTLQGTYNAGGTNSAQSCLLFCTSGGFAYAGMEYSIECFCSNAILAGTSAQDAADCNMACNGDKSEFCGGSNRLNLYQVTSTATSSATTSAPPSAEPLPTGWTARGCYSDSLAARTLKTFFSIPGGAEAMTVEACVAGCASSGFTIAGLEYAQECWCGVEHQNGGQAVSSPETNCYMPCKGNAAEICGGPDRLNVYAIGDPLG